MAAGCSKRLFLGGQHVVCRSCEREYICTPNEDYYDFTNGTDGVCESCVFNEKGIDEPIVIVPSPPDSDVPMIYRSPELYQEFKNVGCQECVEGGDVGSVVLFRETSYCPRCNAPITETNQNVILQCLQCRGKKLPLRLDVCQWCGLGMAPGLFDDLLAKDLLPIMVL